MSDDTDLLTELTRASVAAQSAASELLDRLGTEEDPDKLPELTEQFNHAQDLVNQADERLVKEIVNPGGGATVAKLESATKELNERIEEFKAEEESLNDLAAALGALTDVIKLVLLVA